MRKEGKRFVCNQCGAESLKWLGRCPDCGEWNSIAEFRESRRGSPSLSRLGLASAVPVLLTDVGADDQVRIPVPVGEFSRALGGGLVPGSLVLLGGDPGIGKSTLMLQVAGLLGTCHGQVLYVSGEESPQQISLRASRLDMPKDNLYVLGETVLEAVLETIERMKPSLVVIDSIQTMRLETLESAAGSVGQVRECALRLMQMAKTTGTPTFLVGHVTKEGAIAGPMVLEHIVDTVLYLEGDPFHAYRLLRTVKNRFGSTNEVGVFEMTAIGLAEVANPSAMFLSERAADTPGSAVAVTMEGSRPLLVEIQALTTAVGAGLPRRTANGFDINRLLMLSAVLSKRVGLPLNNQDVFVNVVGGMRVNEPAADLAVAAAVYSSFRGKPLDSRTVLVGEVGLSGELRRVAQVDRRLGEAAKLGFERAIVARGSEPPNGKGARFECVGLSRLPEALGAALSDEGE